MVQRFSGALAAILAQPKETPATVSHEQLVRAAGSSRRNGQITAVLRVLSKILGEGSLLLICKDTSLDGEDRDGWLQRWDDQKPLWTAFSPESWETMTAHVHAADYPEKASTWFSPGREVVFDDVREMFVAPSDLFRLYFMRACAA